MIEQRLRRIALGGKKYHGKDTFGMFLATCYGYQRKAFADPLKDEVAAHVAREEGRTHQDVLAQLNTPIAKDQYRELMQNWGMKRREEYGEYWVNKALLEDTFPYVVTDARFRNEVDGVRNLGGVAIYVQSPWRPESGDNHASETIEPVEYDAVIQLPFGYYDATFRMIRFALLMGLPKPMPQNVNQFTDWFRGNIGSVKP